MWPIKSFEKYCMTHQYMTNIFHDPHKNPPPPTPTYLMYGSLFKWMTDNFHHIFLTSISRLIQYLPDVIFKYFSKQGSVIARSTNHWQWWTTYMLNCGINILKKLWELVFYMPRAGTNLSRTSYFTR